MKNGLILCLMGAVLFMQAGAVSSLQEFSTYQDMRKHVGELSQQKKYEDAARILESHLEIFPDHVQANSYNLALMHVMLKDFPNGFKALEYGLDHGIWYGKYDFFAEIWNPLKEAEGYGAFIEKNDVRWKAAQKAAEPKLEIKVPEDFSMDRSYPLFIALHGGNENLEVFMPRWTSPLLQKEFIVVYPQSSQLVSMNGFSWSEDIGLTRKEILSAFEMVTAKYPIDKKEVIIGGFSSGGQAALVAVLHDVVPLSGFIVLCPPRPEDFDETKVQKAQERGIRGTLLTTQMDPRLKDQEGMRDIMKSAGLPLEFVVTPNTGHWYPEGLDKKIDAAVKFIRK